MQSRYAQSAVARARCNLLKLLVLAMGEGERRTRMSVKLFLVLTMGFVASFVAAMCLGAFLRTALQMSRGPGTYFEPEAAGMVAMMTACYILAYRHFRHPRAG